MKRYHERSVTVDEVLSELRKHADPRNVEGMARMGIKSTNAIGVATPQLKAIAKKIGYDRELAQKLWSTGLREARYVAAFIDDPKLVTPGQMDRWARDFDSWDICDGVCTHLFVQAQGAWKKAFMWPKRKEEFVRRAGFVMMASLAAQEDDSEDSFFFPCFALIAEFASDERPLVKESITRAMLELAKRSKDLREQVKQVAEELTTQESESAQSVASEVLRELKEKKAPAKKKTASKA